MVLLTAVFLLLLAGWILWAWIIAESRDFRLMKLWCARAFVALAAMICLAVGAWYGNRRCDTSHRESVTRLIHLLNDRIATGQLDDVSQAIRHVAESPDEWSLHSPDILARITEVSDALETTAATRSPSSRTPQP